MAQTTFKNMTTLPVPARIQKMNSPISTLSDDESEGGLGYQNTLVSDGIFYQNNMFSTMQVIL
jgi:hypothetical protein